MAYLSLLTAGMPTIQSPHCSPCRPGSTGRRNRWGLPTRLCRHIKLVMYSMASQQTRSGANPDNIACFTCSLVILPGAVRQAFCSDGLVHLGAAAVFDSNGLTRRTEGCAHLQSISPES